MQDDYNTTFYEVERKRKFPHFDEDWDLNMNSELIFTIQKSFSVLYLNRISKAKDPYFKNYPEDHSFKPNLTKNTKAISNAISLRVNEQMKNLGGGNKTNIYEVFKYKSQKNEEFKAKKRKENEENELNSCTFHPSISRIESSTKRKNSRIKYYFIKFDKKNYLLLILKKNK